MTLTDLPTHFQGTRRVAVSPRVVAQLAAWWYAQDINRSGVLLDWYPDGSELLTVDAIIARGDLEWHQLLGEPLQPFDMGLPSTSGWDEAWDIQPGFQVWRVGYWALLRSPSSNSTADRSPDGVDDLLTTRVHEFAFRRLIQELGDWKSRT